MLLDSNIIIYASSASHELVRNFVLSLDIPHVSAVSQIETLGFHKITPPDRAWLERFFADVEVHPIDAAVVALAVLLRQQRKMSLGDSIVAATALVHKLPLATRNVDDFDWIDSLKIVNPLA